MRTVPKHSSSSMTARQKHIKDPTDQTYGHYLSFCDVFISIFMCIATQKAKDFDIVRAVMGPIDHGTTYRVQRTSTGKDETAETDCEPNYRAWSCSSLRF